MPSRRLSPDVALSVLLDAICSRNRYTHNPAPVLEELRAAADDRLDILSESVGIWIGYFEDTDTLTLCTTLRTLPNLEQWIAVGEFRRSQPAHSTPRVVGHSSS
jgi:hypothetical protein